jgi:hypothetical protein
MTIFIPVLWVCINAHCEFMQQNGYFNNEDDCKTEVIKQKQKMRDRADETGGIVTELEGTCIDATITKSRTAKGQK